MSASDTLLSASDTLLLPSRSAAVALTDQPNSTSPAGNCHPSYLDMCLAGDKGDYDCTGGYGNGLNYVQDPVTVLTSDRFDLDRDWDAIGCGR